MDERRHSSHYVLLATLFFVGLELVSAFYTFLLPLTAALLVILVYGIFLVRYEEAERFRSVQIILPALAASGLTGLAFFLPRTGILHAYFAAASLVFYDVLRHGARQAYPTWNWNIALLVMFVNLAIVLGIRFYLYIPVTAALVAVGAIIFLLSYQSLSRVTGSARETALLSSGLALGMAQIAWTLQWLPFVWLVQAGIITVFYYFFFYCLVLNFEGRLTRARLVEYGAVGLVALAILLLSARWL